MIVEDFVEVSYMEMIFKDITTYVVIYEFTWEDDISEGSFINKYGQCVIKKITSHCDGIINVYIDTDI